MLYSIILLLTVPPTYSLREKSEVVLLKEGSSHQLVFDVLSDPPLESPSQHQLSKEGSLHPHESHVYLECDATVVQFKSVRKVDEGTYTISASNVAGRGQITFRLKIKCKLLSLECCNQCSAMIAVA